MEIRKPEQKLKMKEIKKNNSLEEKVNIIEKKLDKIIKIINKK